MIESTFYYNDIIENISELVQIPTVYDAATVTDDMPYGKNVYKGYQWIREKALRDGFEVIEYDGHALAIRIKGSTLRERIDVASHVDVVAPGDGWENNPFSGIITEDHIYGRGTADMKGTLMLTYYALKYIKDNQLPCKRELRVVIGCDEERTMQDMRYYIAKAGEPVFAFTPDGKFPFSLGEKGAIMWSLEGTMASVIEELDGGVQCNVISPIATVRVKDAENYHRYQEMLQKYNYTAILSKEADGLKIIMHGKAAHASTPENGRNATVELLELIYRVNQDPLAGLLYQCFGDCYGSGAEIAYDINPMGKLTLNLGILKITNTNIVAQIDCRYPYGITADILTEKLQSAIEPIKVQLSYDDKPTLVDSASPYLKELLDTYREISKDYDSEPFISGGVTYSKAIPNCVAFGPMRIEDIPLAHQANERIEIARLPKLFELYKETMLRLANL